MAQVMSKALKQRGKNTMEELPTFTETLLNWMKKSKSMKRKGADKGNNLIQEDFHVVDDRQKVVDWTIRNLLRLIHGDPNTYWRKGTWGAEVSPMLGRNLYLTHSSHLQ